MKKVIEKTRPPHVLSGQYESPESRTGVFDEYIMGKMEFEVTMGLYRKGACQINIRLFQKYTYLNA